MNSNRILLLLKIIHVSLLSFIVISVNMSIGYVQSEEMHLIKRRKNIVQSKQISVFVFLHSLLLCHGTQFCFPSSISFNKSTHLAICCQKYYDVTTTNSRSTLIDRNQSRSILLSWSFKNILFSYLRFWTILQKLTIQMQLQQPDEHTSFHIMIQMHKKKYVQSWLELANIGGLSQPRKPPIGPALNMSIIT